MRNGALLVLALVATGCIDWEGLYAGDATGRPFYRLHNTGCDCDLITANFNEVMTATQSPAWIDDGVIGHLPDLPLHLQNTVYRLRRSTSVDWFFTDDAAERDNAIATLGYMVEGSGTPFTIPTAQETPRIPLYRLSKAGVHHYVAGDAARDAEVAGGSTLERTLGFMNP